MVLVLLPEACWIGGGGRCRRRNRRERQELELGLEAPLDAGFLPFEPLLLEPDLPESDLLESDLLESGDLLDESLLVLVDSVLVDVDSEPFLESALELDFERDRDESRLSVL
ncbi:MAG TPA: hypothetical protein VGI86_02345 [Acidimicrobiia bacterium]|jgi:hypothetical protein